MNKQAFQLQNILPNFYGQKIAISCLGLLSIISLSSSTYAQSLDPNKPYPLQSGVNQSVIESLTGDHYWYFIAGPGKTDVIVNFSSGDVLGANLKTTIRVYMYDEKQTWSTIDRELTSTGSNVQTVFSGDINEKTKVILRIQPPANSLIRVGGNYNIEIRGAVDFSSATQATGPDPVVKTYQGCWTPTNTSCGAVKFSADGTIKTSDGSTGTWEVFDSQEKIYVIKLANEILSLKLMPGRGLINPSNGLVKFKEITGNF